MTTLDTLTGQKKLVPQKQELSELKLASAGCSVTLSSQKSVNFNLARADTEDCLVSDITIVEQGESKTYTNQISMF